MEGYTRGTRCRSRSRPLSLEILEDRFLLSAVAYPAEDMAASGGQPPAVVSSAPAAGQDQKAASRAAAPTGGNPAAPSPSPGSGPSTHSSLPTLQGSGSVGYFPGLFSFAPSTTTWHVDSGDPGSGGLDRDGDSPDQGALVASLFDTYSCLPVGNNLGTNDCDTEPLPGAAPVPSHVAAPSLAPSGAAMGLREAPFPIAGSPPRSESVEGGETIAPVSREQPNAGTEIAPVEPQGAPQAAENDKVPLPAGLPFAGLLPIDLDSMRRAADDFFSRLTDLAQDPSLGHPAFRAVPWFGVLTVVAYEWARMHRRPACRPEDGWGQEA